MRFAAALAAIALVGCGGGGGGAGGGDGGAAPSAGAQTIGPIPAAEFATVPPPSFSTAIAAYRTVTGANPALAGDEPALARALFEEVKRTGAGGGSGGAGAGGLFDLNARMTLEVWKLAIAAPLASAAAATTIEPSAAAAVATMPCDADIAYIDGKADALRHALWNAWMTRRVGAAFAERAATAHEVGSSNTAAASAMDLHNNAAGRALATRYPAASDAQLLELLSQQAFALVPAGSAIAAGTPGLVFIAPAALRPLDGRFTGTLTPGGAAAAAIEWHLNQCGATVRGHFASTTPGGRVERRFSGTWSGAGAALTMTLDVADPAPFELATAGPNPCLGMRATLSGDERRLAGSWTSDNCPSGGTLTVAR